jgi:hypothetical protein
VSRQWRWNGIGQYELKPPCGLAAIMLELT